MGNMNLADGTVFENNLRKFRTLLNAGLIFFFLISFVAANAILQLPTSEANSAFGGYSLSRLILVATQLLAGIICLVFMYSINRIPDNLIARFITHLVDKNHVKKILYTLSLILVLLLSIIWSVAHPNGPAFWGNFAGIGGMYFILERVNPLLLWFAAFTGGALGFLAYVSSKFESGKDNQIILVFIVGMLLGCLITIDVVFRWDGAGVFFIDHFVSRVLGDHLLLLFILLFLIVVSSKFRSFFPGSISVEEVRNFRNALIIFGIFWLFYHASAWFVGGRSQSAPNAYFPELAQAFLDGKLYLTDPPLVTDLTFFKGNWYVAFPPLAAILMLPQVAFGGMEAVNTVYFTIFFAALNVALVYLLVRAFAMQGWVDLDDKGAMWMAVLFGLGTVHWYMSAVGQVWYISQLLTVTFAALSVLALMYTGSSWISGLFLAFGMLSRPNIIFLWPFLIGIYLQKVDETQKRDIQSIIRWIASLSAPLVIAVLGLLGYNWLRFGSLFDFGYSTMNVGPLIKPDLLAYGQFNVRYFFRNVMAMFLGFPEWKSSCGFWVPTGQSVSIFITTPALFYLFKGFRKQPWVIGSWISIAALIFVLMFYFNTGSHQFGYRFLMDLIIPVMALLSMVAGKKVSLNMRLLILAAILVNYWGYVWFYTKWCS